MTAALVASRSEPDTPAITLKELGEVVREYTPYVWRVLRSLGVRDADLDDVCQETFIVVMRRLHTFDGRTSPRSWIYGIALRVASDYRGKAHRRCEVLSAEPPDSIIAAKQEAALESKDSWNLLDRLLSRLTRQQREVFILYELESMSMHEICATVGCPLQTAYSRLHAARKLVQLESKQLSDDGVEP